MRRARTLAPDPQTLIIVNCAGRTRSIMGTQPLLNAGIPNSLATLRNSTIDWKLAGLALDHGASRRFTEVSGCQRNEASQQSRAVADRAGVHRAELKQLALFLAKTGGVPHTGLTFAPRKNLQRGICQVFFSAPGGQLVQKTDVSMPVRGARVVAADQDDVRADMSAFWLAQMGWVACVIQEFNAAYLVQNILTEVVINQRENRPAVPLTQRYIRPCEGTDNPHEAMQAYLDWEYGLVYLPARDGTHGFNIL